MVKWFAIVSAIALDIGYSLLASVSMAGPAEYLHCYNAIRAPAAAVSLFGVPVKNKNIEGDRFTRLQYSAYQAPLATSAYIVTTKTILQKTFDYSKAESLGSEPNPSGGGQVSVTASPIFEVDAKYTGAAKKTYLRAKWSVTLDHPNGATLSASEVSSNEALRETKKARPGNSGIGKLGDTVSVTAESQGQVVEYLKLQIADSLWSQRGSSAAYDACHAIPELKEFMESKMNSFDAGTSSSKPARAPGIRR